MTVDLELVTAIDADNPVLGDLRVSGVDFQLVTGIDAVLQEVSVRLRWLRGEWFLDQTQGVPYFGEIFRKGATLSTVRSILRKEIRRVPGVRRVARLEVTRDPVTRQATIEVEIVADDGSAGTVEV